MRLRFIVVLAMSFIFQSQALATDNHSCPPALETQIQKLFDSYHIPGASIAIMNKGKFLCAMSFGSADLATKRPVTNQTLFQACSITKTLTSAAVMQVLDEKHISLDAPVNDYLKRWKIPSNKFTQQQPVTIRMLLNHTAAISNPYPNGGYAYDAKLPTLVQLFQGKRPATNPALVVTDVPGKKYKYCNGCYAILQMFLEDTTGESYPKLMQAKILKPLNMDNSYFDNKLFINFPDKVALPYDANEKRFIQAPSTNPIYATGLLWTTPTDLLKFMMGIQKSLNTSKGFLPQDRASELVAPSSTATRALGFFIANKDGNETPNGEYIMHAGNNIGYLTLLIGSKDGKNGAALMINISPKWNATKYPQFEFIKSALKLINHYYEWQ